MDKENLHPLNINTRDLARNIRELSLTSVHRARTSHIGSALSIADILAVLYGKILRIDPRNPTSSDRDRFILSKGHACIAVYAALARLGFFPEDDLLTFGMDHSPLMAHISHKVSGVEFSTGSLGHGLPFAAGKALAAQKRQFSWRTYVVVSDGELGEGSNWEAIMFAAHHQLNNLVAILDYNKLQALGAVDRIIRAEPLADRLKAFGWNVCEVDGHHHEDLHQVFSQLSSEERVEPSFVIAHTTKGKGVSFMENKLEWHYKTPSTEQLTLALEELRCA